MSIKDKEPDQNNIIYSLVADRVKTVVSSVT